MEIALAWWNTSLSPTFRERDRSTKIEQNTVASMVSLLTGANGFDLVALCEVSPDDIGRLREACDLGKYSICLATEQAGRSAFDMCVLYRPDKFSLLDKKAIISRAGKQQSRVAQCLTFAVVGEVTPFYFFISHWPSRLRLQQHEPGRHLFGTRLRDALDEIQSLDEDARIILLGMVSKTRVAKRLEASTASI